MSKLLISIGDGFLDLFTKSLLSLTYQLYDIRDLKIRGVSFSSTVDLPETENNNLLLGYPGNVKSGSVIPYTKLTAKCVIKGIEFFTGRVNLKYDKGLKINLFNEVIDVFEGIRGKKLYELGYLTDSAWGSAEIAAARMNTTGVLAPVIYYGGNALIVTSSITFRFLPAHSYKDLLLAIIEQSGFDFVGDVIDNNSDLDDLIIPFSHDAFEYVPEYEDVHHFEATQSVPQVYAPPAGNSSQDISLDVADPDGVYFNTATGKYELPNVSANDEIGRQSFKLFIDFTVVSSVLDPGGMNVRIALHENTSGGPDTDILLTTNIFITASPFRIIRSFTLEDVAALSDSTYGVVIRLQDGAGTVTDITINRIIFSGGLLKAANINWLFHNYLVPDLDQTSILEDFLVRFGAFMTLEKDGTTVTVRTFKDTIRDKSQAKDWTDKRVLIKEGTVQFSDDGYSQNNLFKYQQADDVTKGLGNGNLPVGNENLEESGDFFDAVFENTETLVPLALIDEPINVAYIPIYGAASADIYDFETAPGLKLLTMRDRLTDEPAIAFSTGDETDYKVGYFIDVSLDKDTGFKYFLDNYYQELQLAFEQFKGVVNDYRLEVQDIISTPLMVYDSGVYYIVNKIPKFIADKVTQGVELLRVF